MLHCVVDVYIVIQTWTSVRQEDTTAARLSAVRTLTEVTPV